MFVQQQIPPDEVMKVKLSCPWLRRCGICFIMHVPLLCCRRPLESIRYVTFWTLCVGTVSPYLQIFAGSLDLLSLPTHRCFYAFFLTKQVSLSCGWYSEMTCSCCLPSLSGAGCYALIVWLLCANRLIWLHCCGCTASKFQTSSFFFFCAFVFPPALLSGSHTACQEVTLHTLECISCAS